MSAPKKPLFGVFSAEAARLCGSEVWKDPDGTEVTVTWTTTRDTLEKVREVYGWADATLIGPVSEFVRHEKRALRTEFEKGVAP